MKLRLAAVLTLACMTPAMAQEPGYTPEDETALQQCFEGVNDINNDPNPGDTVSLHDCIGAATGLCQAQPGGDSTQGIAQCDRREQAWWDMTLNGYYDQLQDRLEPEVLDSLKLAQRAWIKYRDAKCKFEYDLWAEGTISIDVEAFCMMDTTATRAIELSDALTSR